MHTITRPHRQPDSPYQPVTLTLGYYSVTFNPALPNHVILFDTRTHEGGSFRRDAFEEVMTLALDTFFSEEF